MLIMLWYLHTRLMLQNWDGRWERSDKRPANHRYQSNFKNEIGFRQEADYSIRIPRVASSLVWFKIGTYLQFQVDYKIFDDCLVLPRTSWYLECSKKIFLLSSTKQNIIYKIGYSRKSNAVHRQSWNLTHFNSKMYVFDYTVRAIVTFHGILYTAFFQNFLFNVRLYVQ